MVKNNIIEKENEQNNLNLLYAESQIYSDDKVIFAIEIVLVTILPIIFSFLSNYASKYSIFLLNISQESFKAIIGAISTLITILDLTLIPSILNNKRSLAASIQDCFDCNVLSLEPNTIKVMAVDDETIFKYSNKYLEKNKNDDSMKNWYYSIQLHSIELPIATIMCQRTNCWWDYTLRKKFLRFLYLISSPVFIIITIVSLVNEMKITSFTLNAVLPFSCLIAFLIKQSSQHNSSIKTSEKLKKSSESIWNRILNNTIDNNELQDLSRKLQDEIYQNRSTSPLIFDWFYNKYRQKQEETVNNCIDKMIEKYYSQKSVH